MLYFMEAGSAGNNFVVEDGGKIHKELYIGDINPGEIFGISALIQPCVYTAMMKTGKKCRAIRIEAAALRALCQVDARVAYGLMQATARQSCSAWRIPAFNRRWRAPIRAFLTWDILGAGLERLAPGLHCASTMNTRLDGVFIVEVATCVPT